MIIFLHGIRGRLHSWTDNEYISQWFLYQRRELLGHEYICKRVKIKKWEMDEFLQSYGDLKLFSGKLHDPYREYKFYMTSEEKAAIEDSCIHEFMELSTLKISLYSLNFIDELKDAIDTITPSVPFVEEECIMASAYQIDAMMNTLDTARQVLQEKYRDS